MAGIIASQLDPNVYVGQKIAADYQTPEFKAKMAQFGSGDQSAGANRSPWAGQWGGVQSATSPAPSPGGIVSAATANNTAANDTATATETTRQNLGTQIGTPASPAATPGLDTAFRDSINANLANPSRVSEIIRGSGAKSVSELAAKMGYPAGEVGDGYVKGYLEAHGIGPDALNQLMGNRTGAIGTASQSASGSAELGDPTKWNVTPDQTVEGRIQSIINPESPLMKQAATQAQETANARGLGNSSLAISAGQNAIIANAMPIAQADAATAAKAASYNSDQSNTSARTNVAADNQFRLQGMQNLQQRDLASFDRETQQQAASFNRQTQEILSKLDAQNQQAAAALQKDNQMLLQGSSQAAQAFNTAASAINNIQLNKDMDAGTKSRAIAQVWADVQTQLRVLGSVSGLNLAANLNFANYPGFDANGNFVGFNADGSTAAGGGGQAVVAPAPATAGIVANGIRATNEGT